MMSENSLIGEPVIVTTRHRGVFFGVLVEEIGRYRVKLKDCRMITHWSIECRGLTGVANKGPVGDSRVGPASPLGDLRDVTATFRCTPEAVRLMEAEPWK